MTDLSVSTIIIATIALFALNYAVGVVALRDHSRQGFVKQLGPSPRLLTPRGVVTTAILAGLVIGVGAISGPEFRVAIGGGYLVMQSAALAMNVDAAFRFRALVERGAAEGQVAFSESYVQRATAGRTLAMAVFCAFAAWLVRSLALTVGTLFLFALAVGHYRRARQVARASTTNG